MKEKYWSKVILFGEYSMIYDSTALVIPMKIFSASWTLAKAEEGERQAFLRQELIRFCRYLRVTEELSKEIDTAAFENDLRSGWALASNIPFGYGLGSSGTVVAAVYDRYTKNRIRDMLRLKKLFAQMENFFHGSSSGIDPLQCYLGEPFRITTEDVELLPEDFMRKGCQTCLIDTKLKSSTRPLVEAFKKRMESKPYHDCFQEDYGSCVKACIDAMIQDNSSDDLFERLHSLTRAQLRFFRPMIPESVAVLFETEYDFHFSVKILGSGGGGYLLGFTDDRLKASRVLRNYDVLWLE